jgi:dynein heavy chain
MLNSSKDVPWEALRYVIGEITYGGRVTDDWDRRTLMAILNNYVIENVLKDGFALSESATYISPPIGDLDYYKKFIQKFPEFENPEVFGMHDNANITF